MMKWIVEKLGSTFLGQIIDGAISAYKAKLAAQNTQDARATELAIEELRSDIAARAEARKIVIAEQGRWWTALPRPLFAMAFVIFVWKVVVWDKVLGLGSTDALDPRMWEAFTIILTAYFGSRSLEKIAQVFRGRK